MMMEAEEFYPLPCIIISLKSRHTRPRFRGDKLAPVKTGGGYPVFKYVFVKTGFPFARE
jgi:hypothetical protein